MTTETKRKRQELKKLYDKVGRATKYHTPSGISNIPATATSWMSQLAMKMARLPGIQPAPQSEVLISYIREPLAFRTTAPTTIILTGNKDEDEKRLESAYRQLRNVVTRVTEDVSINMGKGQTTITGCLVSFLDKSGNVRLGYSVWTPELSPSGKLKNPNDKKIARNTAILRGLCAEIKIGDGKILCGETKIPTKIASRLDSFIARSIKYFHKEVSNIKRAEERTNTTGA